MTSEEASAKAIGYAKALANFEQVGELGRAMGAAFMFFRPAATGAARAIEALVPALITAERALDQLPNSGLFAYDEKYLERRVRKNIKILR